MTQSLRCLILAALLPASLLGQKSRIAGPIDTHRIVRLSGNINPKLRQEFDLGPVDPLFKLSRITLMLRPSSEQQAALGRLLTDQREPLSPNYHKWLTPEEYADRFGLSAADTARIVSWLGSQGFTIEQVARARTWIAFSGVAARVRSVFQVQIHRYKVDGEIHFANAEHPAIPAAMEPVVLGLLGLDDFHPKPAGVRLKPSFTDQFGNHFLAPGDLATIYDLTPLYNAGINGSGQTIAIIGQSEIDLSDIADFRTMFRLPAAPPQLILVGPSPGTQSASLVEADIDLEWAGATAPDATLLYVYAGDAFDAVKDAVDNNRAPLISFSFGLCETGMNTVQQAQQMIAQEANAQGITWVAASGDSGAAACDPQADPSHPVATQAEAVNLPASIPEVTGVGGTEFYQDQSAYWNASNGANWASALSYIPEEGWNDGAADSYLASSGGGKSVWYSKPAWQAASGVPDDSARDVPDIALAASADHDGYVVCTGGNCAGFNPSAAASAGGIYGGTSISAPSFAGMLALLQQYLLVHGYEQSPGLGNVNPTLYKLSEYAPFVFHDVTSGNNVVPYSLPCGNDTCTGTYGYYAGPGYDLVTGLGSVDGYYLVLNWALNQCGYTIPSGIALPFNAQSGTVAIDTGGACPWTAWSDAPWLTLTSTTNGTGYGSLSYAVTTNHSSSARSGTIHIAGQAFVVTQSPGIAPDLVITSLTGPTTAVAGTQINVSVTAANNGNVSAGTFQIEFYFSKTPNITISAIDSGSGCSGDGLDAGASWPCSRTITLPGTISTGVWYLVAVVDPANLIPEQNENNNSRAADSGAITIVPPPSLQISNTRSGNFMQGEQGTYSITVTNALGASATSGPVTLTETVASGMSLASMTGTDWSCENNTCTRSDSLGAGLSFPPVSVVVNIAPNAPIHVSNQASVSGGGSLSASTSDFTIISTIQEFNDVSSSVSYYDAVNLMFQAGVTTGCVVSNSPDTRSFCPNDNVTREQMAAFIVRAVTGTTNPANYNPTPYFTDVPPSNPFFPHIQKMMDLGITTGCAPNLFCPTDTIPRWQMAIFMVRARLMLHGASFSYNATPYFADAPTNVEGNGAPFPFIQRSYEENITAGCGTSPLQYCPDEIVTRWQMASFIMRALFNEVMALPPTAPLLTGASPNTMSSTPGAQLTVTITGVNTNFIFGDTVTVPSGMLTVSNVGVNSATSITATLTAAGNITAGPQALVVTTGGQNLALPLALNVGSY